MCYECARGAVPPPWAVMAWSRIRTECVTAVMAGANFLIWACLGGHVSNPPLDTDPYRRRPAIPFVIRQFQSWR